MKKLLLSILMMGICFGAIAQKELSGTVYLDYNNDGVLDGTDLAHPVISVDIYYDADGDGVLDPGETLIGTAITAPDGTWEYEVTGGGNYIVQIDTNSLASGSTITTAGGLFYAVPPGADPCPGLDFGFLGQGVACYAVADGQDRLRIWNFVSGEQVWATDTMAIEFAEANVWDVVNGILYVSNNNQLGIVDPVTGVWTALPNAYGTADGANGTITVSDVDALGFHPFTGCLYGSARIGGPDALVKIDPVTGLIVPDAFGAGVDYVIIDGTGIDNDIDDLTFDPTTGIMYAVANSTTGSCTDAEQLIIIDYATGVATLVDTFTYNGGYLVDVEAFAFNAWGDLVVTTGGGASACGTANSAYTVDLTTAEATYITTMTQGWDYEANDCYRTAPDFLSGTVFLDSDADGQIGAGEGGLDSVKILIYIDVDNDGIGDSLAACVYTDSTGFYEWGTGAFNNYVLAVDPSTLPPGYGFTTDNTEEALWLGSIGGEEDPDNDFGIIDPTLPVELISFFAKANDCTIDLFWSTATETNSKEFIVEHSVDGKLWTRLGAVMAAGFSTSIIEYEFQHKNPVNQENYYRLVQVDLDGSQEVYEMTQSQKPNCVEDGHITELYPNPVDGGIVRFIFAASITETLSFEILDGSGKLLWMEDFQVNRGINELAYDVSHLSDGLYYLRAKTSNHYTVKKFVKTSK